MAKRSRSRKHTEDARPADHKVAALAKTNEGQWNINGPAFAEFDAQIDAELESLVARWIHTAAPGATSVRRFFRHAESRASGQV
jgi:hypothetical protein